MGIPRKRDMCCGEQEKMIGSQEKWLDSISTKQNIWFHVSGIYSIYVIYQYTSGIVIQTIISIYQYPMYTHVILNIMGYWYIDIYIYIPILNNIQFVDLNNHWFQWPIRRWLRDFLGDLDTCSDMWWPVQTAARKCSLVGDGHAFEESHVDSWIKMAHAIGSIWFNLVQCDSIWFNMIR